jgi:hypothetical protein
MKKTLIPIGIIIGVSLLFIATFNYPGGSYHDESSVGYDWMNNYISNLLSPKAVNGMYNKSRF